MITISKVRVNKIIVEKDSAGKVKCSGEYTLLSTDGNVVAKQSFNDYDGMMFDFDVELSKNFMEDIESLIEIEIGVQEAVKEITK